MKLIFLSSANLQNTNFIKELVHYFKSEEKVLLIHDVFGSHHDTRFVTKRISALFSENLIVNNAFSGEQRDMISAHNGNFAVRKDLIEKSLEHVQMLVLNTLTAIDGDVTRAPVDLLLQRLRAALPLSELIMFPDNPKSQMVAERKFITEPMQVDKLLGIYEEETEALERARMHRPVTLASATNYLAMMPI
ncbi:MAG: hypothetical protein AAF570_00635 [Bacteroidota bacterium]